MPSTYIARGEQKRLTQFSQVFNIDNGAGTTVDELLYHAAEKGITVKSVKAVYTQASDSGDASGANFKLGTAVGGTQVVGATALANGAAVGDVTTATLSSNPRVEAGGNLWIRHTGIASTQTGEYRVFVDYYVDA